MSQCCGDGVRLVYACSGAADVGELSDRVARLLIRENFGSRTCLAAVGAGLDGYIQSGLGADENVVIDGCQVECGRKIMEMAGIAYTSFVLTEMGCTKGRTEVTESLVANIADQIRQSLRAGLSSNPSPAGQGCSCGA